MSVFFPNNAGTVRFNNGSATIDGSGTLFRGYRAGSTISIPGLGSMQLAADPVSDLEAVGTVAWGGATTEFRAFEYHARNEEGVFSDTFVRLLNELRNGNLQAFAGLNGTGVPIFNGAGTLDLVPKSDLISGVSVDAHVSDVPGLAAYNGKPGPTPERDGFTVRVANDGSGRAAIYSKNSDDWADWSDPAYVTGPAVTLDVTEVDEVPFGVPPDVTLKPRAGGYDLRFDIPRGMIIEPGATTTLAPDQSAAVTFVPITGGYRLDIAIPRGTTGDVSGVTPFWNNRLGADVDAAAARSGLKAVGAPEAAEDNRVAIFDGDGNRLKDSGKTIAELTPTIASQVKAKAGTDNTEVMSPLRTHQAIGAVAPLPFGIQASVAGNALTVSLRHEDGALPSAARPLTLRFRSASASVGYPTAVEVTGALSLTIAAGSTLGVTGGEAARLWLVAVNNGGAVQLALINCRSGKNIFALREDQVVASFIASGAGAANSAHVFYSSAAAAYRTIKVLGYLEWYTVNATPGNWLAGPDIIQTFTPAVTLPGLTIQRRLGVLNSQFTLASSASFVTTGLSASITPLSLCSLIEAEYVGNLFDTAGNNELYSLLYRDGWATPTRSVAFVATGAIISPVMVKVLDLPKSVAKVTYDVRIASLGGGSIRWNYYASESVLSLTEIQT